MKLFALTVDFAFKSLFAPNPDLLKALLNSFPCFQGENTIKHLKVLNPEIPKELSNEKLSILDIKAENEKGEKFLIEMQTLGKSSFTKRVLYYWAKVYSRGLRKGEEYEKLTKVYSINFVKNVIWENYSNYLSTFQIIERESKFVLTEDLEIHIVELSKFQKGFKELGSEFEYWLYLLKESENLRGESMRTLERKSKVIKEAMSKLKNLSRSERSRELYESRRKAEHDYVSGLSDAFREGVEKGLLEGLQKGIEKGIEKGRIEGLEEGIQKGRIEGLEEGIQKAIESFYLGIQLNLETRFQIKDSSVIMKQIHKIKDIEKLKKLLIHSAKSKTLSEFKNTFKTSLKKKTEN